MIKKTFEIDLTGTELYAVQEIQIDDLTGGITIDSVIAKSCYADADNYIKGKIEALGKLFGKNNVDAKFDRLKNRYTIKVSYDTVVATGSFTTIYAITKLYL